MLKREEDLLAYVHDLFLNVSTSIKLNGSSFDDIEKSLDMNAHESDICDKDDDQGCTLDNSQSQVENNGDCHVNLKKWLISTNANHWTSYLLNILLPMLFGSDYVNGQSIPLVDILMHSLLYCCTVLLVLTVIVVITLLVVCLK